jgi:DNA-binding beta-propeller fold protein YncE
VLLACLLLLSCIAASLGRSDKGKQIGTPSDLLLEGDRKLSWVQSFAGEREVRGKVGFWTKVLDVVAGEPTYHRVIRPYGIAVDSRGRVIVADPGAMGVHVFDFVQHKYKFLDRKEKSKFPMRTPQCVAVDAEDNIYVTDSEAGEIFVYDAHLSFRRTIGSLRGGEGYFKRPTGIAVDSHKRRIYVTDTLRDQIFVLDMEGNVLAKIGQHGTGAGELYFPTELRLLPDGLMVVDAMNFRLQFFSLDGTPQGSLGQLGDSVGDMFRPKGVAVDSEGHYYIVDAALGMVQVFNRQGQLLYYFGNRGVDFGEFQLPSGLWIDKNDRIYVVDSFNSRIQVLQYYGAKKAEGATK